LVRIAERVTDISSDAVAGLIGCVGCVLLELSSDLIAQCLVDIEIVAAGCDRSARGRRVLPQRVERRGQPLCMRLEDASDRAPCGLPSCQSEASVLERVDEFTSDTTTPHGLRATAASHASARGLDPLALQSMMGWADISTARNYVATSSDNTQRELHQIYSR